MTDRPISRHEVAFSIPHGQAREIHRWLNMKHWPELDGGCPPTRAEVTDEQREEASRLHRVHRMTIEAEVQDDGRLLPVSVVFGARRYRLVPEEPVPVDPASSP